MRGKTLLHPRPIIVGWMKLAPVFHSSLGLDLWVSYFELHKALVTSENKEHRRYHDIEALEIGFFVGNDL